MNLYSSKIVCVIAGMILSVSVLAADVVVIVNKGNINPVDKALVVQIYTGESKTWPDGGSVFAIDQAEASQIRTDFNTSYLGKNTSNMKALWAQNIFSGNALPPKVVDPDAEVKKMVASNKNAIGYIRASSVDDSVKVVVK